MSLSYRLIKSGKNQRREYLSSNRSLLFQKLPSLDFAHEQKKSYYEFINNKLPQLLDFYFPVEFTDYNNSIKINASKLEYQEPENDEQNAHDNSHTWGYSVLFDWEIFWNFNKIKLLLLNNDLEKSISQWVENSFKIGKFTCKEISPRLWEIKENKSSLKIVIEIEENNEEKPLKETSKKKSKSNTKKNYYQILEISETATPEEIKKAYKKLAKKWHPDKNLDNIKEAEARMKEINEAYEILSDEDRRREYDKNNSRSYLNIKFQYTQNDKKRFFFLPKINSQGNFIINGHDKVAIFQSIRAPSIYFFSTKENKIYTEIIPSKGAWISISYGTKNFRSIEIKFLNNPHFVINLLSIFKTFSVPLETLEKIFDSEDLSIEEYQDVESLEIKNNLPNFLFTSRNSYFDIGKLGRKKFNQKLNVFKQLENQILAEDIKDKNEKVILKKNTLLEKNSLSILKTAIEEKKINSIDIPHSTDILYLFKIKIPHEKKTTTSIVGFGKEISEEKTYLDLADLTCIAVKYINLHYNLGNTEKEEEKDNLDNQIVRRIGDVLYDKFNVEIGVFLYNLNKRYLAQISRLHKADPFKIPDVKEFENKIKNFFNTSPLVQLQNQNNPLAENSYKRKLSVYGEGGFKVPTLAARNINSSYYGRYDPVETPEGKNVGLIHNLTIGARIDEYGQLVAPYYLVKKGKVVPELVYLTSKEENEKYIAHCNIKINENNEIEDDYVTVRYQEELVKIPKEKIDYIDSSFYHLNSISSSTIPFFHHNDAGRMLMASNMQKQAVTLIKSQEPLVASGIEFSLGENSPLIIKSDQEGQVKYVDSQKVIIKEDNEKTTTYNLRQLLVSNKNVLNFSCPLVVKGEKIKKGQVIANGSYIKNGESAWGCNLRVAYFCWKGFNYQDGIVISERLVKEDILTSIFAKEYVFTRLNTARGPEVFTSSSLTNSQLQDTCNLDNEGIIKVGSWVKGGDILVGKLTPEQNPHQETEAELLLRTIMGKQTQFFVDSSLYLPKEEKGIVIEVKREKLKKSKKELEKVRIIIAQERKIEVGDKLTTRFGNKGIVSRIVPESDMPFDENGKTIDIIFNPLGIPTRMNLGQLLETILASSAHELKTKLLIRPFCTPSLKVIKEIISEAGIKNFGNMKLFDGQTGLPFRQEIYSGYIYVIKLNHMAADKFHSRSTGPYSLIYQQPLKGRAQEGGQRVGEMEAWALEAHGAAYNLMEMMSAKSDDIHKRRQTERSLLFNDYQVDLQDSQSESFNLLLQYLRGIGFDLEATGYHDNDIDFYKYFSKTSKK